MCLRCCHAHLRCCSAQGQKFGITISANELGPGVLITDLDQEGAIYRQGLRVGDVLLSINSTIVDNHQAAIDAIDQSMGVAEVVYVPGKREPDRKLDLMEA